MYNNTKHLKEMKHLFAVMALIFIGFSAQAAGNSVDSCITIAITPQVTQAEICLDYQGSLALQSRTANFRFYLPIDTLSPTYIGETGPVAADLGNALQCVTKQWLHPKTRYGVKIGLVIQGKVYESSMEYFTTLDNRTSVEGALNEMSPIILYPNPAQGQFFVSGLGQKNARMIIFDTMGKQVFQEMTTGETPQAFNVSHLAPGVYSYQIDIESKKVKNGKLVIISP